MSGRPVSLGDTVKIVYNDGRETVGVVEVDEPTGLVVSGKDGTANIRMSNGKILDTAISSIDVIKTPYSAKLNLDKGGYGAITLENGDTVNVRIGDVHEDEVEFELPNGEPIYINFDYTGIPQGMGIQSIDFLGSEPPEGFDDERFESPRSTGDSDASQTDSAVGDVQRDAPPESPSGESGSSDIPLSRFEGAVPTGEVMVVSTIVDLPESQKTFSVDVQAADLFDSIVASIPRGKQTQKRMGDVGRCVERFKELRTLTTRMGSDGNPKMKEARPDALNPLVDDIISGRRCPQWIVPTVRCNKRLYDVDGDFSDALDAEPAELALDLSGTTESIESFGAGRASYDAYLERQQESSIQYTPVRTEGGLDISFPNGVQFVGNNDSDFGTSAFVNGSLGTRRLLSASTGSLPSRAVSYRNSSGQLETRLYEVGRPQRNAIDGWLIKPSVARGHLDTFDFSRNIAHKICVSHAHSYAIEAGTPVNPVLGVADLLSDQLQYLQAGTRYDAETDLMKILPSIRDSAEYAFLANNDVSVTSLLNGTASLGIGLPQMNKALFDKLRVKASSTVEAMERNIIDVAGAIEELVPLTKETPMELLDDVPGLRDAYALGSSWSDVLAVDNGRALMSAMAHSTGELFKADRSLKSIEEKLRLVSEEAENNKGCGGKMAKTYESRAVVEMDNGASVVFDADLDPTRYDIVSELPLSGVEGVEAESALAASLMDASGLTKKAAMREAKAILDGSRLVRDGDYATLREPGSPTAMFFVRKGNRWVETDDVAGDDELRCIEQHDCFPQGDDCGSVSAIKAKAEGEMIDKIIGALDEEDQGVVSEEEVRASLVRASQQSVMWKSRSERQNRARLALASTALDPDRNESPLAAVLDAILGQGDFVKRNADVRAFALKYTRGAVGSESPHWRYCSQTGAPLLPTFLLKLAEASEDQVVYLQVVREICHDQGTISDDGDCWVDKHSGRVIAKIELENQALFSIDQDEFTKRVDLNIDLGASTQGTDVSPTHQYAEYLARFLGVDMGDDLSVIAGISESILASQPLLTNRATYNAKVNDPRNTKKVESYDTARNMMIVLGLAAAFVTTAATATPPARPRRAQAGCSIGDYGRPFPDGLSASAIDYVACVLHQLKHGQSPWNSIERLSQSSIAKRINSLIDKNISNSTAFQTRVKIRQNYDLENPIADEAQETSSWVGFRPPFGLPKVDLSLLNRLPGQDDQQYSLQTTLQALASINDIVAKEQGLLKNSAGRPYVLNSCCPTKSSSALSYFDSRSESLLNAIAATTDTAFQLNARARKGIAPLLFDPLDTKFRYPELPSGFTLPTVIGAFAKYCRIYSHLPPRESLKLLCGSGDAEKMLSDLEEDATVRDRRFKELLLVLFGESIVPIPSYDLVMAPSASLISLLSSGPTGLSSSVQTSLLAYLKSEGSKDDLLNACAISIERAKKSLSKSLGSTPKDRSKVSAALDVLSESESTNQYSAMLRASVSVAAVFPNEISNGMCGIDQNVPKHWGLSSKHEEDVKGILSSRSEKLERYCEKDGGVLGIGKLLVSSFAKMVPCLRALSEWDPTPGLGIRGGNLVALATLMDCLSIYLNIPASSERTTQVDEGEAKKTSDALSSLCAEVLEVVAEDVRIACATYESIVERSRRVREREKDLMTEELQLMGEEERGVDNILKKHKLGRWGVGLQKGFKVYEGETYDHEREDLDKKAAMDASLDRNADVVSMNRDLYRMDIVSEAAQEEAAEFDNYDISMLPNDDDYGDLDGDEGF